jgi:hypothetical protein
MDDGSHISGIDLGGRELSGTLPSAKELAGLSHLKYLMLSYNKLTGAVPALNFSAITGCGFGAKPNSCCWLSSTVSNVYDEDKDSGVTNKFDCPLPPGAAELCHAQCTDGEGRVHGYKAEKSHPKISRDTVHEATQKLRSSGDRQCQQCVAADPSRFPQCDVKKSLMWYHGHISHAYCTDSDLVVFADAIPNHRVRLEEMPKPPGSGPQAGDFSVRIWNTQSYAYRIPLRPKLVDEIVNYTGAGALAMTLNGVSMYPIMSPGVAAIDLKHKWRDGHNRDDNMKLDWQLDRCNEHAGRGFDIHYHADPKCMYNESQSGHSPIIGWAADGFPLYGKYNASGQEPDDLDRCNGHLEDVDQDGEPEYHYHVSPQFPYTIACWHGDTSNLSYTHGGQPGQEQWAFDNLRTRTMKDRKAMLPCCSDTTAFAPSWFQHLEPYAPIDHDNLRIHRAAANLATIAPSKIWMYALHGDWGTDEVGRLKRQEDSKLPATGPKGDGGHTVCNGASKGLLVQDCNAWQDLFDATGGSTTWDECKTHRTDPCGCVTDNGEVACGAELAADDGNSLPSLRIVSLGLMVNGLTGSLPGTLANMTALTDLQLEGNHIVLPHALGLGGVLPSNLPFSQYVGCGLEGNAWTCPLPPDAIKYCSAGQPLTCSNAVYI